MLRVDLIIPVRWQGQTVTAVTVDRLRPEQMMEIRKAHRRIKPSQRLVRVVLAIAADCPLSLANSLSDFDLHRAEEMVAQAIELNTEELLA